MKTAIIGLGNIGSRVAGNLVAGGESVIVAARDWTKAQALAKKLGSKAEATSIEDAVKKADVVILGMWFETIKEVVVANRASLVGKVIVDPSNPIAPDGSVGSLEAAANRKPELRSRERWEFPALRESADGALHALRGSTGLRPLRRSAARPDQVVHQTFCGT
jgi:glutamyl-tRNA reductase